MNRREFLLGSLAGAGAVGLNLGCNSKLEKQVRLRDDGVFLMNGNPFYPIGTYRDPRDTLMDFESVRQAGFNLAHSYYFESDLSEQPNHNGGEAINEDVIITAKKYLYEANKKRLKVFMGLPREMIRNEDLEGIKEYVSFLKNEPSLLVWYLFDEPEIHHASPSLMRKVKNIVSEIDPIHPTLTVFSNIKRVKYYEDSYDIAGFDQYPIYGNEGDVNSVKETLEESKKQIGNNPFWHIVQAHDLTKHYDENKDKLYLPSVEQIKCMTYLGIISGAKATIYYWSPSYLCNILEYPKIWKGICSIVQELNEISPILTARDDIDLTNRIRLSDPENLPLLVKNYENNPYLFITNPFEKTIKTSLSLSKDKEREVSLRPYEVRVMEI